jgi:hypothetical protein
VEFARPGRSIFKNQWIVISLDRRLVNQFSRCRVVRDLTSVLDDQGGLTQPIMSCLNWCERRPWGLRPWAFGQRGVGWLRTCRSRR